MESIWAAARGWQRGGSLKYDEAVMRPSTPRGPVRVADLLARAVPGLDQHLAVEAIRGRWAKIVGPEGARRSRPDSLRQGVLTVSVDNSSWLHELTLRSGDLLARVQAEHGQAVTSLRFMLGRMSPAGARENAAVRPTPPRRLRPDERREIQRMTADIADPALAATLERLLTKDRLARGWREAPGAQPTERHEA